MSAIPQTPDVDEAISQEQWDKATSRAIGKELRRAREANGWSRGYFVTRLPSGIGDRTLLSYEHGTRHLTLLRFIELCRALEVAGPVLLQRALQRARLYLDTLPLRIDLYALALDESGAYPFLIQGAHNTLVENPRGVVEVRRRFSAGSAFNDVCYCSAADTEAPMSPLIVLSQDDSGNRANHYRIRTSWWSLATTTPSLTT